MDKKKKPILDNKQGTRVNPFDKLAFFLSANPYILAAGWFFTIVGGFLAIFTINMVVGIIIMILFSIFLIVIPKHAPSDKGQTQEPVPPELATTKLITLSVSIPPSLDVIGRDKDITNIFALLANHNIVSIRGEGGVGKTAIATKIANQVRDEIQSLRSTYKHIAWITSTGNFKEDLMGLDIPSVKAAKSPEERLIAIRLFFENSPTFLIIDNMDEPPVVEDEELMNTISGNAKIIITTRASIPISEIYDLNNLDPENALILFYRHYKGKHLTINEINNLDDISSAKLIIEAASFNTLFIELIGKMAYADHWNLDDLWKKLKNDVFGQDSQHEVSTDHLKSHPQNKGRLLTQIQNLYKISELSNLQKEIMSFMALFPPERSIFFDVFKWAGFEDDNVDNLGELQKRGWIERGDEGYLIHTMVKGSVEKQKGKKTFDEERYGTLIDELANRCQYMSDNMVYTKVREFLFIPETVCKLLIAIDSKKERSSVLYHNLAALYEDQGDYKKALEYYERCREIQKKVLGTDHPSTATTYNNMAGVYQDRGDYEKTLEYYEKALSIFEKMLGHEHPNTKIVRANIEIIKQIIKN